MSTVTVGCRIPNGLHLDINHDGQKARVTLNGPRKELAGGVLRLVETCGFTNVDSALWEAWLAAHKDDAMVKGGHVFAESNITNAKANAKSKEKEKTGHERLNPDNPVPGVKKADKDK